MNTGRPDTMLSSCVFSTSPAESSSGAAVRGSSWTARTDTRWLWSVTRSTAAVGLRGALMRRRPCLLKGGRAPQRASAAVSPRLSSGVQSLSSCHPAETTACRLTGGHKTAPARLACYCSPAAASSGTCGTFAQLAWAPFSCSLALVHTMPGPCRHGSAGETW